MDGARRVGAYVVALSTDYVFDGEKDTPYHEWDTPNPRSVYGESKLAGEFEIDPDCAVVRTSWVCGQHGNNTVKTILRARAAATRRCGSSPTSAARPRSSPTSWSRCGRSWSTGCPAPGTSRTRARSRWYEFARAVLTAAGDDPGRVEPITTAEMDPPRAATRPANSELENRALRLAGRPLLPDYRESLPRLVEQILAQ